MIERTKANAMRARATAQDHEMIDFLLPRANSFIQLRWWLGFAAAVMPLWLIVGGLAYGGIAPSISDFYHSVYRDVLVGNLAMIGAFFIVYQGDGRADTRWIKERHLATICGFAAIGVAGIPNENGQEAAMQLFLASVTGLDDMTKWLHVLCAFIFFSCLAIFCFCIFGKDKHTDKARLYKTCGITIAVCTLLLFPTGYVRNAPGCVTIHTDDNNIVGKADCNWTWKAPFGVTRQQDFDEAWQREVHDEIVPLSDIAQGSRTRLVLKTNYVIPYAILFWLEAIAVWAFTLAWVVKTREVKAQHEELRARWSARTDA